MQGSLVHHGHHFSHVMHAFCNVQILIMNGIAMLGKNEGENLELLTAQ